jgi:hypothetical protein
MPLAIVQRREATRRRPRTMMSMPPGRVRTASATAAQPAAVAMSADTKSARCPSAPRSSPRRRRSPAVTLGRVISTRVVGLDGPRPVETPNPMQCEFSGMIVRIG